MTDNKLENIISTDIINMADKFSMKNLVAMREAFPNTNDSDLARFLIARSDDVAKASALLEAHLSWHLKNMPVLKAECIVELMKEKIYVNGYDKEGHLLVVWNARNNDYRDRSIDDMLKMVLWWVNVIMKKSPADKSKISLLFDRTDFQSHNHDLEFIKAFGKLFQDNYPERLGRCIVYPSGLIFWGLWSVIKYFLDPVTQQKVSPVLYLSGVQEFIEDKYIPEIMGGKSTFKYNIDEIDDPYTEEELAEFARLKSEAIAKEELSINESVDN